MANVSSSNKNKIIAKTFFGTENVCAQELTELGAQNIEILNRAVSFDYDKKLLYKVNLWSRTAVSFISGIADFSFKTQEDFYNRMYEIDWNSFFSVKKTILIKAVINRTAFSNSHYVSMKAKDAIVDYFRDMFGERPSVDSDNPDIKIDVYLNGDKCIVSIDSSGAPLFKRGYRKIQGEAPINEALAANLLIMGGYKAEIPLIDPMCGSGTFAIEAALMATNTAPGLLRKNFSFQNWNDFDAELWDELVNEANGLVKNNNFSITAFDIDSKSIDGARQNILRAGMLGKINLSRQDFFKFEPPSPPGMVIINPPYGQRLKTDDLLQFYNDIGKRLKFNYPGYKAWIISSEIEAIHKISLRPIVKHHLLNGKLECRFDGYELFEGKRKEKIVS
jgi:putative N6-adenine-specific DNA methylase